MGYLLCKSCEGRYDLKPGELPGDFDSCVCGGELEFYDDQGHKRLFISYNPGERKKMPLFIKILIVFVLGSLIFNLLSIPIMLFMINSAGSGLGSYFFPIFFVVAIVAIIVLIWYGFIRNRNV